MKKIIIYLLTIIIIIIIYLSALEVKANKKSITSTYNITSPQVDKIQSADIILRLGYGVISESIAKLLNEEYKISHCGIIVPCDSCLYNYKVIHSVSSSLSPINGVQDDCLEHFIRNSQPNSIIITRYKNLDSLDILNLIYWSNYFLDRQIPFDHNFDIVDSSSFYCSELIHYIFKKANVTLLYDCLLYTSYLLEKYTPYHLL